MFVIGDGRKNAASLEAAFHQHGGADETRTRRQWRNAIACEPRKRIALREPVNDVETESVTVDSE
jgi:hypothetical protein